MEAAQQCGITPGEGTHNRTRKAWEVCFCEAFTVKIRAENITVLHNLSSCINKLMIKNQVIYSICYILGIVEELYILIHLIFSPTTLKSSP